MFRRRIYNYLPLSGPHVDKIARKPASKPLSVFPCLRALRVNRPEASRTPRTEGGAGTSHARPNGAVSPPRCGAPKTFGTFRSRRSATLPSQQMRTRDQPNGGRSPNRGRAATCYDQGRGAQPQATNRRYPWTRRNKLRPRRRRTPTRATTVCGRALPR